MTGYSIDLDGRMIAYTESAGRGRPIVLVHGNSSAARTWKALADGQFGARFRCLAIDRPGHGRSAPAPRPELYSLPGYAEVLVDFARTVDALDAVFVGWSLGGHIVLEAAPRLAEAAGFVVFGTPPIGSASQLAEAFLPNPAVNVGFTAQVDRAAAEEYAASFLAPGSAFPVDDFVDDILATDGAARSHLSTSVGEGRFADEVEIVDGLAKPLAILHGADEQLISLEYLRKLTAPTLWRGAVQVMPGAGHAPHEETPQQFAALLTAFMADLG
jgi:pimeloyl-ACP methyl ester carboxylesterase